MSSKKSSTYFTRHLLRAGLQCPVKLYYYAQNFPENIQIKPYLAHSGFNKYHLKKLAGHQYPQGVLIRGKSRQEAAQRTAKLLERQNVIILEAAFIYEHYYAKVPILIKRGDTIQLLDIQTKAFNPHKHHLRNQQGKLIKKWKPYIVDLAYKEVILQKLYPQWQYEMQLLLPDKTKKATHQFLLWELQKDDADLQNEDLFCRLEVTSNVKALRSIEPFDKSFGEKSFDEVLEDLKERYLNARWECPPIGKKCSTCEFRIAESQRQEGQPSGFDNCWTHSDKVPEYTADEPTVLDLIGPGVTTWIDKGIFLQKNIPLKALPTLKSVRAKGKTITQKQRQTLQIRRVKGLEVPAEIIKKTLFDEITRWEYPLHFIDFEAGNYAVPLKKNQSPYDLVLFQFSCHTLYSDGRRTHHQWIAKGKDGYPNYELVRQLMKIPDIENGTIVQYSKFEHSALKRVRRALKRETDIVNDASGLINWLDGIVERRDSNDTQPPYMADISRLVKNYYYNCYMNDSLSIKDVLESILNVSKSLKKTYVEPYQSENFGEIAWWQWDENRERAKNPYKILRESQGNIQIGRGTEAMVMYGKFLTESLRKTTRENIVKALLQYCELDTLAMVMIYEHWKSLAAGN